MRVIPYAIVVILFVLSILIPLKDGLRPYQELPSRQAKVRYYLGFFCWLFSAMILTKLLANDLGIRKAIDDSFLYELGLTLAVSLPLMILSLAIAKWYQKQKRKQTGNVTQAREHTNTSESYGSSD